MLPKLNIRRPLWATRCPRTTPRRLALFAGLASLALFVDCATAAGQPNREQAGEEERLRDPDAGEVTRAWFLVRDWLNEFSLPDPDAPAAQHEIEQASGVCIIIRRKGEVLGIGTDLTGDARMVRRAAGRAFGDVHSHPVVQGLDQSVRANFGEKLTLELEVAGPRRPVLGRTFREVSRRLRPGLEGVAMRRGGRTAARFPSQMLATNTARNVVHGQAGLPGLALELGLPVRKLSELRNEQNVSVYRFETTHLAQQAPSETPFAAFRGDTIVSQQAVDEASIRALADGIAAHVMTHRWPGDEPRGLLGDYEPIADEHKPVIAPPMDQALAVLALARYANSSAGALEHTAKAREAAQQLLNELAQVTDDEDDPLADPVTCAAIVCAALEPGVTFDAPQIETLVQQAKEIVLASFTSNQSDGPAFLRPEQLKDRTSNGNDANEQQPADTKHKTTSINHHGQALLTWAITRLAVHGEVETNLADAAIEHVFSQVEPRQAVLTLPWLGWAAVELAEHTGEAIHSENQLRELLNVLDAARLGSDASPDVRGGFALTRDNSHRALADSQALRPAAFVATAVRTDALRPADQQLSALGRHLATVRFLLQLQVREDDIWRYPQGADAARGGLRNSPWESSQPVPAQAMGLLMAVETLRSLDESNKTR